MKPGPGDYCRIKTGPHAGMPVICVKDRGGVRFLVPGTLTAVSVEPDQVERGDVRFNLGPIPDQERW